MKVEALAVPDAWLCTPVVHRDARGHFLEWFRFDQLAEATGRQFEARQANHSLSGKGVVRGIHYADVPPGQAKLVYCTSGSVLDIVVDLRLGSPTYAVSDNVVLSAEDPRMVYISEGLGHAFCALTEDASMVYLVSTTYDPAAERTIDPRDARLALPWPSDLGELVLSPKDASAPTLNDAERLGMLPEYAECVTVYRRRSTSAPRG